MCKYVALAWPVRGDRKPSDLLVHLPSFDRPNQSLILRRTQSLSRRNDSEMQQHLGSWIEALRSFAGFSPEQELEFAFVKLGSSAKPQLMNASRTTFTDSATELTEFW